MYISIIPIFWDITPSSPLKVNRRFGGICRHAKIHHEAGSKQSSDYCLLDFNRQHGVCYAL
jgi:hypothetical protein